MTTTDTNALEITFPSLCSFARKADGNVTKHVIAPESRCSCGASEYSVGRVRGWALTDTDGREIIVIANGARPPADKDVVLRLRHSHRNVSLHELPAVIGKAVWVKHPFLQKGIGDRPTATGRDTVSNSWAGAFHFVTEEQNAEGATIRKGLRRPQIGAIHAILAHWTTSRDPATVVMPTGTGKTEVMLAVSVAANCQTVLVVVPTDPLREQTAEKFAALGVLHHIGALQSSALNQRWSR
jgi:hypothetical protein